ncbi:cyclin-dependent kinase inhibitor 1D isoform X1 [Triplophysa rosa]|nr:cyclin-dependent kinase inhibitor 1D isoform X1 [Triplophysa rosa]
MKKSRDMSVTQAECDFEPLEEQEEIKPQVAVVCRNLFGPVDHQQLQQDFQRLFCMSVEVAKHRWNFDFQRDQPAPGSIEWEELPCQDVPAFYRSCVVRAGMVRFRGVSFSCSPATSATEKYVELRSKETLRGTKPEPRMTACLRAKRKQANITDFFRVTKRRLLHHKNS